MPDSTRVIHPIRVLLVLASLSADGETAIEGANHVDVSFSGFFGLLEALGVSLEHHD